MHPDPHQHQRPHPPQQYGPPPGYGQRPPMPPPMPPMQLMPPTLRPPRRRLHPLTAVFMVAVSVFVGLVALGAVLSLVSPDEEPSAFTTVRPSPVVEESAPAAKVSDEDVFVLSVRSGTALKSAGHGELVTLGRAICTALDEGHSLTAVALQMARQDVVSARDAGYITGAAVRSLCPRHKAKIPD